MITIVTGEMNEFKTTKIIELYEKDKKGDGFVSLKQMVKEQVHGYDAVQLSTREKKKLNIHERFFKHQFEVCCEIGPYKFNKLTIKWIETQYRKMILEDVNPLYLDEVGMLELSGQGFHHILIMLIASQKDLVLVVRRDLIHKVISVYQLKDVLII